jgi:hypothetical protein
VSEVVGIRGNPVVGAAERQPLVIEQLETVLERARSGDVQGVQIFTLHSDGLAGHWQGGLVQYSMIGMMFAAFQSIARDHYDSQ